MKKAKQYTFQTRAIHAGLTPEQWQGATLSPIVQSVSNAHASAEPVRHLCR
jgi:O-acetylhomoserine/O-acetylserine sulfhydrylase-like pyridoxal-dependent enzyme